MCGPYLVDTRVALKIAALFGMWMRANAAGGFRFGRNPASNCAFVKDIK